jgi:hypothetical protein
MYQICCWRAKSYEIGCLSILKRVNKGGLLLIYTFFCLKIILNVSLLCIKFVDIWNL